MSIELKRLSLEMIEEAQPLRNWLEQFPSGKRTAATSLLLHLRFVSRDVYSEWLKSEIQRLEASCCFLYAVRKLGRQTRCLWDKSGKVLARPSRSMGSEDLVHSVVANLCKENPERYLDHPNLNEIKKTRDCHIVLIDDSSGSGDRISSFICRMMSSKSFLSRWSFGWIHIHVLVYARSSDAAQRILESVPGSDHPLRKHPKHSKLSICGPLAYTVSELTDRWGKNALEIGDLCDSIKAIPPRARRGYGNTLSHIVFYHSVPNNLPGVVWKKSNEWKPLFPGRSLPTWLPALLEGTHVHSPARRRHRLSDSLIVIIGLIRRGVRREATLSRFTGLDTETIRELMGKAREGGLLTVNNRLSEAGAAALRDTAITTKHEDFNRSLYIPKKWCADRETVQPSGLRRKTRREQTESASSSLQVDGDVGQASLERTDAKTASPSLRVTPQNPSTAREGGDAHGPLGCKEK